MKRLRTSDSTYLRELTLVQVHADSIHLLDGAVKVSLEITVGAECFANVTGATILGVKFNGLEVVDVLAIEEHVADSRRLLVDLERMTRKDDPLSDNASGVR